jgi:hypothetical protein
MAQYYIHVRQHAGATAFAVIGPYQTAEAAEQAAEFAHLPHWTLEERQAAAARLFSC